MPPKKKGGANPKTQKDDGELPLEQKYRKALEEIETLKEMLSVNKELTQKAHEVRKQCRERTLIAEQKLSKFNDRQDQMNSGQWLKDIDISRQYKTMQSEVGLRNTRLDYKKLQVQTKHEKTTKKLLMTQTERDRLFDEKDQEIADQRVTIASRGIQYEYVIMDTLDNVVDKIGVANRTWEKTALNIQAHHKQKLRSCGHTPLEF